MIPNIVDEVSFRTSRSGGPGGQNVNKVETSVEGFWNVGNSRFFSEAQKLILIEKLSNRLNKDGHFVLRSQIHRSQLANKVEVLKKMHVLILEALKRKKLRIASKPSKAAKENRLSSKKKAGDKKALRQEKFR